MRLFFYVGHFWVLHALAAMVALAVYGRAARGVLWMPVPSMGGPAAAFPPGFGCPLWATYAAWLAVLALPWPACRWLAGRREANRRA